MRKILLLVFMLIFLGSVAAAGYFYWQWRILKDNPVAVTENENKFLIEAVGRLIMLPDEQPTIATVTDPSKLSDQSFFANAKVGYKVLVYSEAKKAILYDPIGNIIIEVGPVTVTEESEEVSGGTVTNPQP